MAIPGPGRLFDNRLLRKNRTDRCAFSGQPATNRAKAITRNWTKMRDHDWKEVAPVNALARRGAAATSGYGLALPKTHPECAPVAAADEDR